VKPSCLLLPALALATLSCGPAPTTWHHDVQPLVQRHCQSCHRAGDIAPFALDGYDAGLAHHQAMAAAVASGLMPPWKPSAICAPVQAPRTLTPAEREVFVRWSEAGAPEGDPATAPPPPDAGPAGLPGVSASLTAAVDYTPTRAAGNDDYRCLVLDPGLAQAADVVGLDIQPGVRALVHHVIVFHAAAADVQAKAAGSSTGWTCFGSSGVNKAAMIGGWVPGTKAQQFPATTGVRIPAGHLLVMQVHYNLAVAEPAPDRTVVRLQYAAAPVARPAAILGFYDFGFSIPPSTASYTHATSTVLPVGGTIWGALPHLHTLGRDIRVSLDDACLIDIPDWDFHWQQLYFFERPVAVDAGTTLGLSCTWSNPEARTVTWGEGTADEMCLTYLYATF
jgi:hypothetical protein